MIQPHPVPIVMVSGFSDGEGSNAQFNGITVGDEILSINGVEINADLKLAVQELESKPEAVIKVRQHKELDMVVAEDIRQDVEDYINYELGLLARPPPPGNVIEEEASMISLLVCAPPPPSSMFDSLEDTAQQPPPLNARMDSDDLIHQYETNMEELADMEYPESFVEVQDTVKLRYIILSDIKEWPAIPVFEVVSTMQYTWRYVLSLS